MRLAHLWSHSLSNRPLKYSTLIFFTAIVLWGVTPECFVSKKLSVEINAQTLQLVLRFYAKLLNSAATPETAKCTKCIGNCKGVTQGSPACPEEHFKGYENAWQAAKWWWQNHSVGGYIAPSAMPSAREIYSRHAEGHFGITNAFPPTQI